MTLTVDFVYIQKESIFEMGLGSSLLNKTFIDMSYHVKGLGLSKGDSKR